MKCPNCKSKLPLGAYIFNNYKCKVCGGVISYKLGFGIFCTFVSLAIGKLIYSENYLLAILMTLILALIFIKKMPDSAMVEFDDSEKD